MQLIKGQRICAEITGYTSEGHGVARVEGQAVFVPGAIAGETAELEITHVGNRGAIAEIRRLEVVSPHRVERACVLGKRCGGCDFWHMDYEEELRLKAQRVRDALMRIGGNDPGAVPICGAQKQTGYRNKAQFPVAKGKKGPVAGFYQARSHEVVPVEHCLIQSEQADLAKEIVLNWMQKYQVQPYHETRRTGCVRHIYVRTAADGQCLVCVVATADKLPHEEELVEMLRSGVEQLRTVVLSVNRKAGNVVLGDAFRNLWGDGLLEETLCGLQFQLSARSFFQVNRDQAERLYEKAVALAGLTGRETAVDLYCGTGTISLILAKNAARVIGVEVVAQAIVDAEQNAARNGIENAEFLCADAGEAANMLTQAGTQPDVVLVDPPRKGLAPAVVDAIVAMAPTRIVYVSCDPATLARDVKLLGEKGYTMAVVEAFDMFPRCAHVECCVLLTKKETKTIN